MLDSKYTITSISETVAYIKPEYSKNTVNQAGEVLIKADCSSKERSDALKIINNWRYSHIYPMQKIKQTLDNRVKKIDILAVTAQRLKRLQSIENKLSILSNSKLSRMQDLGGCRAVLATLDDVYAALDVYRIANAKNPVGRSKLVRVTDYIQSPRSSGYRSMHLLMQYESDIESRSVYNGQKIEIQLRTKLQHSWATAVETVSTFIGQKLKSGIGDKRWLRFFALASSVFASKERCPYVPDTPTKKDDLLSEIEKLSHELNIEPFLRSCIVISDIYGDLSDNVLKKTDKVLLTLNASTRKIDVEVFGQEELDKAAEELAKSERHPELDVVLVGIDSLLQLKTAYPNYFADTTDFVENLAEEIDVKSWF